MSRNLLLSGSAMALVTCLVATAPARAQVVPDASIEGPIQMVTPAPGTSPFGPTKGEMKVMGVKVVVLVSAPIHTDTNPNLTLGELTGDPMVGGSPLPRSTRCVHRWYRHRHGRQ